MFRTKALYVDGGVIGSNPSIIGCTWAYCCIDEDGHRFYSESGAMTVEQFGTWPKVENNGAELLAMVRGLQQLPNQWTGLIVSDSLNTIGRTFGKYARNGIPLWLSDELDQEQRRLDLSACRRVLVKGHPTKRVLREVPIQVEPHLVPSFSHYPISHHNVWCDEACKQQAAQMLLELQGA